MVLVSCAEGASAVALLAERDVRERTQTMAKEHSDRTRIKKRNQECSAYLHLLLRWLPYGPWIGSARRSVDTFVCRVCMYLQLLLHAPRRSALQSRSMRNVTSQLAVRSVGHIYFIHNVAD